MSITNVSKTSTSIGNASKVLDYETWATISTTWASETRNWGQTATVLTNSYNTPDNTYTVSATTFAPITLTGAATSVTLNDDDYEDVVLPFRFNFFGIQYDNAVISSNGFLAFASNRADSFNPSTIPFPGTNKPNAVVYGYWYDLDPTAGGTIKYETIGDTGSRVFVVEYANIKGWNEPSSLATFQIILHEADNSIEIHTTTASVAFEATQGIENQGGTVAFYLAGRNYASLSLTNDAVRFARTSLVTNVAKP